MDIIIRTGTIDDAQAIYSAILGIGEAIGEADKVASTVDDIRRHGFGGKPAFETLIAEVDGRFAGLSLFFPSFSTFYGKPGIYVQDLYVAPEFRGRGVAEHLMRETAQLTRQRGGTYIRLSADAINQTAQKFYKRIGMRWAEEECIFVARHAAFDALCELNREGSE